MRRISTGNIHADLILDGGFPANSINIIMGHPGVGKTIFAEQLAFTNATPERPVLYLTTLSEPLDKFIVYLQEYTFADATRIGTEIIYESLSERLMEAPEQAAQMLLDLVQEYRPRLIIIDSFRAIGALMPDLATWRRVLYQLAGVLSAYDATSFWVGEYDNESVSELPEFAVADGILELVREQSGSRDERRLRVVKLRGSAFRDGYHSVCLTRAGLEVYPRMVTPFQGPHYTARSERLHTGIGGLDAMIESGWLRGTSTLVLGPSGAGKTVLSLHFLREGARRGEPGLLVSFQENPTQMGRIMEHFGWQPDTLVAPDKLDIFYNSPVELQIDTILTEMFRRVERNRVRRVVIDAIGDLERCARDQNRFRDYMYALTQQLAAQDITAMICVETPGLNDRAVTQGKDISAMGDNILRLEMHMGDELVRTIRVIKSRGSAHDNKRHVLHITGQGIRVD